MKYKVTGGQKRGDNCLVCGFANRHSLGMDFWELENGELASLVSIRPEHQSYPGRTHGGIITAMLDEVIGRAVCIEDRHCWGVTTEINVKFKKPVPLEETVLVVGRVTRNRSRMFEGTGEIYAADGTLLASAAATYMKMSVDRISQGGSALLTEDSWRFCHDPADMPDYIELPY